MRESIVETLKNMKSEQNLTLQQISSASGVPLSTVNRILSGQTENPSFRDVAAIVAAMDGSLDAITGLQKLESENGQLLDSNVMQLLLSMQNYYAKTLDATHQQYMRELENQDKQYRDILTDKNRWLRRMFFCLIGMLAVIARQHPFELDTVLCPSTQQSDRIAQVIGARRALSSGPHRRTP